MHGEGRQAGQVKKRIRLSVHVAKLKNDGFPCRLSANGSVRLSGLPSTLLAFIGEYGIIFVMTLTFPQRAVAREDQLLAVDERWMLILTMHIDALPCC